MRDSIRGFLVLSVLLWLIAGVPGTPVPGAGGVAPAFADDTDEDEGLCNEPGDADQVAAVRAMAAEQCDCDGASNHGKYVSCVAHVVNEAIEDGLLRAACSDAVVGCAAASTCGRPGFVTCCQTDSSGNTTCSIKHDGQSCTAPPGGTACVGSQSSCCDACGAGGSCSTGGSTTTTSPPEETTTTTVATETSTTTAPAATTTTTTGPGATTTTTQAPIQCCEQSSPMGAFVDCLLLSDTECATQNGINAGAGTCSPNPCPPSSTTTPAPAATTTTAPAATTTTTGPAATTTTTAPVATTTTTTTTPVTTTTTLGTQCCGFSPKPSELAFTTGIGAGNCGTVQSGTGVTLKNLACGGLFTGGGSNSVPLPYAVPDMGSSLTAVSGCSGTVLTLANVKSNDAGATNRNCTSVGCLFGPPLPIPNAGSAPTSVCVINTVSTNASGTADCSTGASALNLPLTSEIFLTGDIAPDVPGIQPCPVCLSNVCHGGPNNGLACTPADSALNDSFPTTHDCPPPAVADIGGLPIAFALTTGTTSKTAQTISGQNNVFCGFCRDVNNLGSGCFAGDQTAACPDPKPTAPIACTAPTDCPAAYPDCQQRNAGAFGPAGGGAHTITETGSPAGAVSDGGGHPSTLVSIFCIQPTFNATVDAAGDLPGPGAVSLPGTAQLLP